MVLDWLALRVRDMVGIMVTAGEYEILVGLLDELIDEVGEDEAHPLASLMEIVGVLKVRRRERS